MNSRRSRRILSGAVITLAAVALAGCSVLESVLPGVPDAVPEGEADVFAIAVGDCLNDASISDVVTSVPIVDCAEPHDSEVFARTDTTTPEFPGDAAIGDELLAFCQGDVFTQFVGIPYADSIYETSGYFPTQESWDSGDRELLCTIWDPAGPNTGTLAGANQ